MADEQQQQQQGDADDDAAFDPASITKLADGMTEMLELCDQQLVKVPVVFHQRCDDFAFAFYVSDVGGGFNAALARLVRSMDALRETLENIDRYVQARTERMTGGTDGTGTTSN